MKSFVVGALAIATLAGAANATVAYSFTTETGSRWTPTANVINFDDVFIDNALIGGNNAITLDSVTVGIRRLAGAGATTINVYAAPMLTSDLNTSAAMGTPVLLGSVNLGAQAAAATVPVTVNAPLTTILLNSNIAGATPLFSGLFIGVQVTNLDTLQGWRIVSGGTVGANFTDRLFTYNTSTNTATGPVAFAPPTPNAAYAIIDGTFVPAPSALGLIGLGGLVAVRRRR
ncbi:MAG: PEP-CTERM sorting domain-containing protein [Phycisphaerales bacterium]